jgi:hypothetical protein
MASTITGRISNLLYVYGPFILVASVRAGSVIFHAAARASLDGQCPRKSILPGGLRSFEVVPLETDLENFLQR